MKTNYARTAASLLLAGCVAAAGCGNGTDRRNPDKWLSLSYAGLAAMDQYAFSGSMSISMAGGAALKPQTFEGKVVDHRQLTVQTSSDDPLHVNPLQILEQLNESNKSISIVDESSDPPVITLQIAQDGEQSKQRWAKRLKEQLEELLVNSPPDTAPYKQEWENEANRSRMQLEQMLATMSTETSYQLVIDKNRLLPLKLDEQTEFRYRLGGKESSESRHTAVRFQAFDGSSSIGVQQ